MGKRMGVRHEARETGPAGDTSADVAGLIAHVARLEEELVRSRNETQAVRQAYWALRRRTPRAAGIRQRVESTAIPRPRPTS